MDGSRIRKEKVAFSNENDYVWKGPKSLSTLQKFVLKITRFCCDRKRIDRFASTVPF